MKSFLISDNKDTWVGLRLAGIEGVIVKNRENALKEIKKAVDDTSIGIIIATEKVVDMIKEEFLEYKIKSKTQIIMEIPDRNGSTRTEHAIKTYIRDSVGIHI